MSTFDGYAGATHARHKVLYILAGVGGWVLWSFLPLVMLLIGLVCFWRVSFYHYFDWDQGAVWGLGVG